jgi:hypothetical protein
MAEGNFGPQIHEINEFLDWEIARFRTDVTSQGPLESPDFDLLDSVFRSTLSEV